MNISLPEELKAFVDEQVGARVRRRRASTWTATWARPARAPEPAEIEIRATSLGTLHW